MIYQHEFLFFFFFVIFFYICILYTRISPQAVCASFKRIVCHFVTEIYVSRLHKFSIPSKIWNIFCLREKIVKYPRILFRMSVKTPIKHLKWKFMRAIVYGVFKELLILCHKV